MSSALACGKLPEPALGPLERLGEFVVRHDLDVPADELGRQPDVLPAAADGQRQLIVLHEHDRPAEPRIGEHFRDLRRLQGVRDQHLERVVPADDVDALAVEFLDDVLDAAAANADAGADAIDLQVDARDGDLGAVAGLAGDGADVDGAVVDLGDFFLEQRPHEVRVAPRQHDLDAMALLADVENRRP